MRKPKPAPPRRASRLEIAIVIGVAAVVVSFLGWKWSEAESRVRCVKQLMDKGIVLTYALSTDTWSSDWPFYNVQKVRDFRLCEGRFKDDDVRRLRRAFPGASIFSVDPGDETVSNSIGFLNGKPVKLPEDKD
jgi:hypothetical protein